MKFSMMKVFLVSAAVLAVVAYGALPAVAEELDNLLDKPRIYVGSDKCKSCHQAQYYSWRTTMHSRMAQDARANKDAIIVELDEKRIRADLAKRKLKVPADQIYVPKPEEIKYTIGSKWKQRGGDPFYLSCSVQLGYRQIRELSRSRLGQTTLAAQVRWLPYHRGQS
jgi:hypothetical protein